jgi:endothelin-converting enzyme/putative endopeptidase
MFERLLALLFVSALIACSPPQQQSVDADSETGLSQLDTPLISGIDLSAQDKEVRAQDDFFRHVNGGWLTNTPIPDDKSSYGAFNIVYDQTQQNLKSLIIEASETESASGSDMQKLGDMYSSYLDEERVEALALQPLQPLIAKINGIESHSDVAQQMGELFKLGVSGLFGFFVYPDLKQPQINALYLYQSGLTMPDRDYYLKTEDKYVQFRQAMHDYMTDVLTLAEVKHADEMADALLDLEIQIANAHITRVKARDAEKNYNKQDVVQVIEVLSGFDWPVYSASAGVGQVESLVIRNTPYFEKVGDLFAGTEAEIWKYYLLFKLLNEYAPRMYSSLADLHFTFHSTVLRGIPEQRPRWKRSVAATSNVLGEVLGKQYVARHFTPDAKARMQTMVNNLQLAYAESIAQLNWMSEQTKQAALQKLDSFIAKIGYPDSWRDYSSLQIDPEDLVGNYVRYSLFEHDYYVNKIGQPIDPDDWGMTPQTINAYYSPGRNEIVFPAGILQPPFFNLDADDAVNYGAIGAVIGHEIGHGFDDQGSKYDGEGNLRNWWSEEDRAAFDALGANLVAQYDQFEPIEGQNVNGQLTLGENIGDLAGVTISYQAYQMSLGDQVAEELDGLTGAQRFFMGYAQVWRTKYREDTLRARLLSAPHSPAEYRVNGVLPNVDAFYQAFDVRQGDKMYLEPAQRVKIW